MESALPYYLRDAMSNSNDNLDAQPSGFSGGITIYTPVAGQKTKVKVTGSSATGQICVLGLALDEGGPEEIHAVNHNSEPFPMPAPTPPSGAAEGTCVENSSNYNFMVAPVGGVDCNAAGTILNRVDVWVTYPSGTTEVVSVEFYGQCDDETECEAIGNIDTIDCGS